MPTASFLRISVLPEENIYTLNPSLSNPGKIVIVTPTLLIASPHPLHLLYNLGETD